MCGVAAIGQPGVPAEGGFCEESHCRVWKSLCVVCWVGRVGEIQFEIGDLGCFGYFVNFLPVQERLLRERTVSS